MNNVFLRQLRMTCLGSNGIATSSRNKAQTINLRIDVHTTIVVGIEYYCKPIAVEPRGFSCQSAWSGNHGQSYLLSLL